MSARTRLALDAGLFVALLVAYYPARTGLAVHEWLSIAVIAPMLLHVVLNWDWAVRIASRFAEKMRSISRVDFAVDVLLFVSTVAVMLSGIIVSRSIAGFLGIAGSPSVIWYALHSYRCRSDRSCSWSVHLGLHWRWIARILGLTKGPRRSAKRTIAAQPLRLQSGAMRHAQLQPARARANDAPRRD